MTDLRDGAAGFFTEDHQACDQRYGELEKALDAGKAEPVRECWTRFERAITRHLSMEEEVLFPAFEEATGMRGMGPTAVMRHEHEQMRALLRKMAGAISAGDFAGALDAGDTLLMIIQQHNVKEEGMLYPMADEALGGAAWEAIVPRLEAMLR